MTKRRHVDDDRDATHAIWQAILQSARDAIVAIDQGGHITLFNSAAEAMFGYSSDEVLGRNVNMLMPDRYRVEHDGFLERYQKTGVAMAIGRIRDVEAIRRNGEIFPIELSVAEANVPGRTVYTAVIRDVTNQRIAEEEVRNQVRLQSALTELGVRALADADLTHVAQESTRLAADVLGCPFGALFFHSPTSDSDRGFDVKAAYGWAPDIAGLYFPDPENRTHPGITLSERRPSRFSEVSGDQAPWFYQSAKISDGVGVGVVTRTRAVGVLAVYSDRPRNFSSHEINFLQSIANIVAEAVARIEAESAMIEAQRTAGQRERLADIGAITARLVHDLGNPLAALSMQAQLILRRAKRGDFEPTSPVLQPTEQILATLQRLQELVHEFNDFAREQRLRLTELDTGEFLEGIAALWRPLAAARSIILRAGYPSPAPRLRADRDKLRRVLDNLVKNAIDAIGTSGGIVQLSARRDDRGNILIDVDDSGPGIADGIDVFRLFETTKSDGTGIGLAVAKQIVQAHGGTIGHEPGATGGTRFRVSLPADGPPFEQGVVTLG